MTPQDVAPPWRAASTALWLVIAGCSAWLFVPVVQGYFISDDFVPLVLFDQWQQQGAFASRLAAKFAGSP